MSRDSGSFSDTGRKDLLTKDYGYEQKFMVSTRINAGVLEEIQQKRAAERSSKTTFGPDLKAFNQNSSNISSVVLGIPKSDSRNQITENDSLSLLSRSNDLERRNVDLEDENKIILSKEENNLPSLRKALRDALIEKDAALVAKEDLLNELRTLKKRLKEAEEDQYRAEEDASALRAEINSIQQGMRNPLREITPFGYSPEHIQAMEKEIAKLKSELQQESSLRLQEQYKLAEEQAQVKTLMVEKKEMEEKILALSKKTEEALEEVNRQAFSVQEKDKTEKQLHDMAVMVERLESSRQKLLMEVDSQSSDIERLFEENTNLSASYKDSMRVIVQWENQVKDCLKQNEDLRVLLDKLRSEQTTTMQNQKGGFVDNGGEATSSQSYTSEYLSLKTQLSKEQSRAEALSAEVLKLSAELKHAVYAYNHLILLYKPVLREIEAGLIKMKRDDLLAIR